MKALKNHTKWGLQVFFYPQRVCKSSDVLHSANEEDSGRKPPREGRPRGREALLSSNSGSRRQPVSCGVLLPWCALFPRGHLALPKPARPFCSAGSGFLFHILEDDDDDDDYNEYDWFDDDADWFVAFGVWILIFGILSQLSSTSLTLLDQYLFFFSVSYLQSGTWSQIL